jgi:hypothetical protein
MIARDCLGDQRSSGFAGGPEYEQPQVARPVFWIRNGVITFNRILRRRAGNGALVVWIGEIVPRALQLLQGGY